MMLGKPELYKMGLAKPQRHSYIMDNIVRFTVDRENFAVNNNGHS